MHTEGNTETQIETVIVGAGQAGLATGYHLKRQGRDVVILDAAVRVGDQWRQQWDTLKLYSPAQYDGLPGLPFPAKKWTFPGKEQVADYLELYAAEHDLPVRLNTRVESIQAAPGGGYVVTTATETFTCDNVVVATGTFGRTPDVPDFAKDLDPSILQMHSSEYRRPAQLRDGPVLVVGGSHSGTDIAYEVAESHPTILAGRDPGEIPFRIDGKPMRFVFPILIFAWRHILTRRTPMGRKEMQEVRFHGGPMLRVKRSDLAARDVERAVDRVTGVSGGRPVVGDRPVEVANVVWATGFRQNFDWIGLPIVGEDGWPVEMRGVVDSVPGLFFCGLSFQYAFSSMVLPGVGRDAEYVAGKIIERAQPAAREGGLTARPGAADRRTLDRQEVHAMGVVEELVRARETYERGDWATAFGVWNDTPADALTAVDLDGLGTSAYLLGRVDNSVDAWQRAFQLHVDAGDLTAAVRSAFLLSMCLANSGDPMVAAGWAGRAHRLLDDVDGDVAERGYVEFLLMFRAIGESDWPTAIDYAARVADCGRRFADRDLLALGLSAEGRTRLQGGQVTEGLALFDEAMAVVTSGAISPIVAGNVYCVMIEGCQEVSDLGRASAWTGALSRWCSQQPGLLAFTGQCAVHRGQIMRLHGAYSTAIEELDDAVRRYLASPSGAAAGLALAERGDVLRIIGDLDAAEASYEQAADHGHEPQPGLALLWLARGRTAAAVAAARRLLAEISDPVHRSRLLPAATEILLAAGEAGEARAAAEELGTIANAFGCAGLQAMAAYAAGRVELEVGDAPGALPYLRKASALWNGMDAPYEIARVRVQVARAMRTLGDEESAASELAAALRAFTELGTVPAADEATRLLEPAALPDGLTTREAEVLRLVASGKSNSQIATELVLSDKTVARHLSNIFAKLGVGSRTAAAAYAFEHQLA